MTLFCMICDSRNLVLWGLVLSNTTIMELIHPFSSSAKPFSDSSLSQMDWRFIMPENMVPPTFAEFSLKVEEGTLKRPCWFP